MQFVIEGKKEKRKKGGTKPKYRPSPPPSRAKQRKRGLGQRRGRTKTKNPSHTTSANSDKARGGKEPFVERYGGLSLEKGLLLNFRVGPGGGKGQIGGIADVAIKKGDNYKKGG